MIMWRRLLSFLTLSLALTVTGRAATPTLAPVTGTLVTPDGTPFTGTIAITFPYAGATDTSCSPAPCMIAPFTAKWPVYNGSLPVYAKLSANPNVLPLGTFYVATLYDVFMSPVETFNFVIPSTSSFDIGSAQQTNITTTNLNLVSPASLTGNNTFTGINSFTGAVSYSVAPTFTAGFVVSGGTPSFANGLTVANGTVALATSAGLTMDSLVVSPGSGSTVKINQHFDATGSGYKHLRTAGCSTTTTQFNTCALTVTWTGTAFVNANYTPSCAVEMTSGTAIYTITAKIGASMSVTITNLLSGTAAVVSFLDCTASHD